MACPVAAANSAAVPVAPPWPPSPYARRAWPSRSKLSSIAEEHWNDASAITDPDGNGPRIYFQRAPEPKAVKRLTASGAAFVAANTRHGEYCVTMLDPEGNEFDVH
jgi:hypothetical protein